MANESRLSITIDSRSAEQQAKDLEKALDALDGAGIRVVNTTDRAGKTTSAAGRTFSVAGREAKQGAGGVDDLNRSLAKTDDQAARTAATLRRVLLAATAGFSAMSVIDTADQWGQYASRIRMATESTEEYDHVQKRMVLSANETYRSIQETREAFINLSPVIRDMGFSLDQSIDAVDAFSGLLVVNGANAERGAAAMAALSKSLQKGKVDADAWMTIYSTADTIVNSLALSTGKSAEEIRKLGVEGKITGRQLVEALGGDFERIMGQVRQMPTTVRDALQNLGNAFSEYIGWSNEANGITAGMASGLEILGKNFETVANIVGGVAATALFVYTARTIESTRATIASFAARTAAAKSTLDEAQAQAAQTATTLAQTRALAGLTASHAQVIAATKAHEASLKQLAVAQAGYTRAGMALLGVLGGPVGLGVTAALAAASFLVFSNSADDTATSTKGLTHEVNLLTEAADKLTAAQTSQAMAQMEEPFQKAKDEAMKYRAQVEYLTKQLEQFPSSAMVKEWSSDLVQARGNADTASQVVAQYEARLAELQARLNAVTGAQQGANAAMGQVPEAVQKQLATLDKQISLFGKTGQAAQVYYDLERGALKDLAPEHKQLIRNQADVLAGKEKDEDARRKGIKISKAEAKEIDSLLKSLRDQASVLGMTEQQAARYRIETAKGTDAQRKEALALLDKVQAHKAAEQATKLNTEAMREQRNLAAEIAVFQNQQNLEVTGMGLGERRRQELQAEYAVQEEFARRRRELDEAQRVESTRMDEESYLQQVEYLRLAEEQKLGILQESAANKLIAEQSWITGAQEAFNNYIDTAGNVASQVEGVFTNAFSNLEDTIFNFVKTGELDLRGLLTSIGDDVLRMLIKMGVQMAVNAVLGKTLGAASTAASVAMAGTTAAAWAPAAALASLASFGGNAIPAAAGILSTVALSQGLALTGMAHDGIESVPKTGTWLLEKGERVTTRDTSARLDSTLARIDASSREPARGGGGGRSGITVNLIEDKSRAGQAEERTGPNGEEEMRIFVADIMGEGSRAKALERTYGLRRVGR